MGAGCDRARRVGGRGAGLRAEAGRAAGRRGNGADWPGRRILRGLFAPNAVGTQKDAEKLLVPAGAATPNCAGAAWAGPRRDAAWAQ